MQTSQYLGNYIAKWFPAQQKTVLTSRPVSGLNIMLAVANHIALAEVNVEVLRRLQEQSWLRLATAALALVLRPFPDKAAVSMMRAEIQAVDERAFLPSSVSIFA